MSIDCQDTEPEQPDLQETPYMPLTESDLEVLRDAYSKLENPSLAIRLSSMAGTQVETVVKQLSKSAPKGLVEAVADSSQRAIEFVMTNSAKTLSGDGGVPASPRLHKAAAATTGAFAGFFGLATLAIELPLTTAIMFRSIVDIARAEGESPRDHETILNAMQVFAMGSDQSTKDDGADTSYYGIRFALSKTVSETLQYLASHNASKASAPALVRFISAIATRFGVVVTQKAMAQALPVVGAVGGGLVNTIFISHFQDMARGHFAIRRLERIYGVDAVRDRYRQLADEQADET